MGNHIGNHRAGDVGPLISLRKVPGAPQSRWRPNFGKTTRTPRSAKVRPSGDRPDVGSLGVIARLGRVRANTRPLFATCADAGLTHLMQCRSQTRRHHLGLKEAPRPEVGAGWAADRLP